MSEQNKEVGVTSYMPGTDGFTMACFHAKDVPVGTKLYVASKSPAPIPEQVAQAESGAKEMAEQLRRYHELEVWDWDILLNAANTIERLLATQSAKQDPVAQEVTQQAAKAETAEQANVLPPFAAPASKLNSEERVEAIGEVAELYGRLLAEKQRVHAEKGRDRGTEYYIADAIRWAIGELDRRFRAQGGNTNAESSDLAPTTSTVSASGNSSKNSSSSEGDQAAVDDVRNQALEEAVEAADAAYLSAQCSIERGEFSQPIRQTREAIEAAIRALRTTPTAAQAAADKSED